ncbi:MAG: terminase large subunit [Polaromonas sp.]|nr:terminase large subunit [Polaromonas sp.]
MTPEHSTACLDWQDRIRTGKSIIPAPIFPEEAAAAVAVMKELRIVDAPGSPTMGEACAPWVFELAAAIFGSYDADSGRRLIKEFFVLVSKKNSKSTVAGAIMLTALIRNWRQSAQFAILSPTVEVATNSYSPARDMVAKDDELDSLMHVQSHIKTITHRESNATLKVLAADSNTVGGLKAVGVLVDELHLFGKVGSAENMFREAFGGLASRPEGFIIYLTTQSDEPPSGVFKQKLDYARAVRDGKVIDPGFLPVIFEHPDDMVASGECLNLENMWMTNPNMGFSVDQEFLEREFMKAELSGGDSFRGFMAKHGNVEIGLNLRSDRWAGADFWQAQGKAPGMTLDQLLDRSEVVDVGVDGGGLDDLLGLAVVGRDKTTREWLLWTHAWAHPSVLERRKSEAARFKDFAADGDLTLVQNIGEDVEQVAEVVARCEASGLLDKVGCDPAGLGGILDAMVEADIPEAKIVAISQGWKMTGAIKTTERKLAEGALIHGGQPMMNWCVGNAKVEPRGNAVIITKQASGTAKIDPLLATFNAVTLMSLNPASESNIDDFLNNPIST